MDHTCTSKGDAKYSICIKTILMVHSQHMVLQVLPVASLVLAGLAQLKCSGLDIS
jgi:hypothetical protein